MNEAERAVLLARLREVALATNHDPDAEPLRNARKYGTAAEEMMRDWDRRTYPQSVPFPEGAGAVGEGHDGPPMSSAGGGDGGGILGSDLPQGADTNQQGDPEHEGDDTTEE